MSKRRLLLGVFSPLFLFFSFSCKICSTLERIPTVVAFVGTPSCLCFAQKCNPSYSTDGTINVLTSTQHLWLCFYSNAMNFFGCHVSECYGIHSQLRLIRKHAPLDLLSRSIDTNVYICFQLGRLSHVTMPSAVIGRKLCSDVGYPHVPDGQLMSYPCELLLSTL